MESKFFGSLILALCVVGSSGIAFGEDRYIPERPDWEPNEYWFVDSILVDDGYRRIPVYYVDQDFYCSNVLSRGCHVHGPGIQYVILVESKMYDWDKEGCTVRDHEYYHAMGYRHGEGPLSSTCAMFGIVYENYKRYLLYGLTE